MCQVNRITYEKEKHNFGNWKLLVFAGHLIRNIQWENEAKDLNLRMNKAGFFGEGQSTNSL